VVSINIFVFIVSYTIWSVLNSLVGITLSKEAQVEGTDVTETGVIAYAIRD
jgi:ammonium transporter, Amt family